MPSPEALRVYLQSLARKSYYDVLRIARDATPAAVKSGFHEFSLLYHPDRFVYSAVQKATPSRADQPAAPTPSRPLNGLEVRRARKPSTGSGVRKKTARRRAPKAG